jgi:hypothetical protein
MKRGIQLCGATSVILFCVRENTWNSFGFSCTVVIRKKIIIFILTNRYRWSIVKHEQRKLSLFRVKEKQKKFHTMNFSNIRFSEQIW